MFDDSIRRKGTVFIDAKGRPLAPFSQEGSRASPTSELENLRDDLAAVLYKAKRYYPHMNYLFGTTVKKVVSNDKESVMVELSNGQLEDLDILVAADGQWLKGLYAVYWTIPRLPSDSDWWNVYLALESRIITLRPDPYGTTRAMFARMPCNGGTETGMQEKLLSRDFADAGWQAQRLLDAMNQAPDFYFHTIQQIKMSKWSNSRFVCLGDAAYAPTPLTGMGTSLAITGAYVLAGELSKLEDGEHPSQALEAYESAFRPFVEEIQKIPFFVGGIVHPETARKRWLFQAFVWATPKVAAIPWLASRSGESNDDGVPLPQYPSLDYQGSR